MNSHSRCRKAARRPFPARIRRACQPFAAGRRSPVSDGANLFGEPDFTLPDGVAMKQVGKHAAAELLGATVYWIPPQARWADLHVHYANEEMIVVLEGSPTLHTLGRRAGAQRRGCSRVSSRT